MVFFDIDGTLIPFNEKQMPDSTYKSLMKLHKKGIKIIVATGKSLAAITKLDVMRVPFNGYLTLNGQLCYDEEFRMNFGYPIIPEEMEVLQHIFFDDKIPFILIGEFSKYINFMNDRMLRRLVETHDVIPDVGKYHGERIYQITASLDDRQRKLLEDTLDYCQITSWSEDTVDIFCRGGGKMNAVKNLLQIYDVKPEEVMAFGDSENDIQMLKYVGTGIAMGNGTDQCKEAADYITTDIHDDGIQNALKHFGLI